MAHQAQRQFSPQEKAQLIANLDIEVAHKTRQFNAWLADHLENFTTHQEGHVSRMPKQVRTMKMREFGEKYGGNVQAALRGIQRERFVAAGGEGVLDEIDKTTRKRKWVASQELELDASSVEGTKAVKNGKHCFILYLEFGIYCRVISSTVERGLPTEESWFIYRTRHRTTSSPSRKRSKDTRNSTMLVVSLLY